MLSLCSKLIPNDVALFTNMHLLRVDKLADAEFIDKRK